MVKLITDHIDIWTSAQTQKTNGAGRGNHSAKHSLHGIKKLRELILELAVQGKLVPQEPNDEPASVLLEKIAKEKARLIKEGKIKKQEPLPEITDDEKLFALPNNGWVWSRLGDIGIIFNGNSINEKIKEEKYTGINGGLPFIATKDVGYGWDALDYNNGILIPEDEPRFKVAHKGAVLICAEGGSAGKKCGITNQDICFGNKLFAIELYGNLKSSYILVNYLCPSFYSHFTQKMTGIIGGVSTTKFSQLLVPIPPAAEQHRIVTKVDELMALCDQLEQHQTDSNATHQTLLETLLAALTIATNQDEFIEAWQRIANHFDILFTTEQSIDQLKQTILQLAVMGKLVPQDPNDEPASVLLEKITKEKTRLIKEGKIKKQDRLLEITDDEKPFEIPHGWVWVRFGEVVNFKSDLVNPNDYLDWDQIAPDSIEKGTGKLLFRRTVAESGVIGPNNKFCRGQILYSKIRPSLSKAILAAFNGLCSADMYPLEPMIDSQFLLKEILSNTFLEQVRIAENRVKMPKLNIESLSNIIISVSPLTEQYRIVAKVDELMALCDKLKAHINDAQTIQVQLADAIVEQAVA